MPRTATKLLIVDDESTIRSLLSHIFRLREYEVRTACNGFDALKTMRDWTPDVLISDLNMPEMSGFELLSVVRRRMSAMYVVASSGAYDGTEVPDGIMADAFHPKAQSIQALVDTVATAASRPARKDGSKDCMPIWVERSEDNGLDSEAESPAYAMISCPECLRALPQVLREISKSVREAECQYCLTSVLYAVVQEMQPVMPRPLAAA